jgi:hypothetical protein
MYEAWATKQTSPETIRHSDLEIIRDRVSTGLYDEMIPSLLMNMH